jgi:hypothetical protein
MRYLQLRGSATPHRYTRAKDEDRALFQGYIYGFVVAKIGERGSIEVGAATARVKSLLTNIFGDDFRIPEVLVHRQHP